MWKWTSKKEAHRILRGIDGRLLKRSGLHDALWMDWARPEEGTTSVREFVLNWDDRTQSSTVGGREIPLTIDTMREYFLRPEGLNPRGPRGIMKTYLIGCPSGPGPPRLATYFKEKIREEIRACKKQMQASGKRKVRPTCSGIVVLHILRTCGIVDDEDIVQSDSDKSLEEVTHPRSARAPPVQVLSSSPSPDRVQALTSSSPERVQDLSPNSPERKQVSPDPRDISSSSSPGRHQDSPYRQHSPKSSPWGRLVLSMTTLLAMGEQPARIARNRLIMNLWLGLDRPWCRIRLMITDEEGAIAGFTSLGASDPSTISKGKRPVLHKSSSESEEIRFARPDRMKRRVADTEDEADSPVSQHAEMTFKG
ncbi:hypothetical protein R1sor_023251 [Riccia sorocarpa]|uniref:R2R3-MYB transcription factor n=1 Tax=Riccia sorocarpa TaxID=122646 RepID=A0ABD3GM44_9MARC